MKNENFYNEFKFLHHWCMGKMNKNFGELSSLMTVYNDYDKPEGLSPFDVFGMPEQRALIIDIQQAFPEGKIIEYLDDDILVDSQLLFIYLQIIDSQSYRDLALHLMLWENVPYKNRLSCYNESVNDEFDFIDDSDNLPF